MHHCLKFKLGEYMENKDIENKDISNEIDKEIELEGEVTEEDYTFVNEVIIKKKPLIFRILIKVLYLFGMAGIFVAGSILILLALDRDIKNIFKEEKKEEKQTNYLEISTKQEENKETMDSQLVESEINKMMLTVCSMRYEEETASELKGTEILEEEGATAGISDSPQVNNSVNATTKASEKKEENSDIKGDKKEKVEIEKKYTGIIVSLKYDVFILTSYDEIAFSDKIFVEFADNKKVEAKVFSYDKQNNLAMLTVKKDDISKELLASLKSAIISKVDNMTEGQDIYYAGRPFEGEYIKYNGKIKYIDSGNTDYDTFYRGIVTDMNIKNVNDGFIFDSTGKLLALVKNEWSALYSDNFISAMAVSDMYKNITNLLNDIPNNKIGIKGEKVTKEMETIAKTEIPSGLYVTEVSREWSAYSCGIMVGDIIKTMNKTEINSMKKLKEVLDNLDRDDIITIVLERKIGTEYNEITVKVPVVAE